MVTYNRAHLLERSLEVYSNQPFKDFELIIIDDDSTDNTQELLKSYSKKLNIVSIIVRKNGEWRDCACNINLGLRAAKGDFIVATHPEVIPGWMSLTAMNEMKGHEKYITSKIYFLSIDEQNRLDTVDWKNNPLDVRNLEGFYESGSINELDYYSHAEMDKNTYWESWVFGGMSRKTWRRIGGFTEFTTWGSVDIDFSARRYLLNIPTITLLQDETFCIHQNHDDPEKNIVTPRDIDICRNALQHYNHPYEAIKNNL